MIARRLRSNNVPYWELISSAKIVIKNDISKFLSPEMSKMRNKHKEAATQDGVAADGCRNDATKVNRLRFLNPLSSERPLFIAVKTTCRFILIQNQILHKSAILAHV